eukprot:4758192-Prymnesium_polylepis.1
MDSSGMLLAARVARGQAAPPCRVAPRVRGTGERERDMAGRRPTHTTFSRNVFCLVRFVYMLGAPQSP